MVSDAVKSCADCRGYTVILWSVDTRDWETKETGAIVTAEEHSIIGGLGSAVTEVLCEEYPVPVLRLGVEDTFGKSGPAVELLKIFGLDAKHIAEKAKKAVALK